MTAWSDHGPADFGALLRQHHQKLNHHQSSIAVNIQSFGSYLRDLSARYRGPVIVFDMHRVYQRVAELEAIEHRYDARLLVAAKSCPEARILGGFARRGRGFDVSNAHELAAVTDVLEPGSRAPIMATGPRLADMLPLLERARDAATTVLGELLAADRLCLVVGSAEQLARVRALPWDVPHALRLAITPHAAGQAAERPFLSRFGFAPDDPLLADAVRAPNMRGFHCHTGIKSSSVDDYVEIAGRIVEVAERLGVVPSLIDLGGGLTRVPITEVEAMMIRLRAIVPPATRLLFEFGDYWFDGCGFALAQVLDVSLAHGGSIGLVTTDLSADCHLRWSEPVLMASGLAAGSDMRYLVCGPTCHEGDVIGAYAGGPASRGIAVGDILTFGRISPYSLAWNTSFNGIDEAAVELYGVED